MAKLSGTSVAAGQQDALTQQAAAQGPVKELKERVPQASAPQSFDDLLNAPEQGADVSSIAEGAVAAAQETAQIESERIPTARERYRSTEPRSWEVDSSLEKNAPLPTADGGFKQRAKGMADKFATTPPIGIKPHAAEAKAIVREQGMDAEGSALAEAEAAAVEQPGSLRAALHRSDSLMSIFNEDTRSYEVSIDRNMLMMGSAVTENYLSGDAFVQVDPDTNEEVAEDQKTTPTMTAAQANDRLGRDIHREYMRMKNDSQGIPTDDYVELSKEEANTLGHAFKVMYAQANPDIVTPIQQGNQTVFQLTDEGKRLLNEGVGSTHRKKMFPKTQVRPSKVPTKTGQLPGEVGKTVVKKKTGAVKRKHVNDQVLQEATRNFNKVANVVDTQRMRILLSTALPVISGQLPAGTPLGDAFGDINNIGPKQAQKFAAAEKAELAKGKEYSAEGQMTDLQYNLAQQIRSIAMERHGANHLTYFIQSSTGRITPQQLYFNPTTSKAVRFVTRNVVPAKATPGSRISRNLEQMYAMMLVPKSFSRFQDKKGKPIKVDQLLPHHRIESFNRAAPQLEKWGDRLAEVLDASMTPEQANTIAEAIEAGTPLDDPQFPPVNPLALDPAQDADLIKEIAAKGEDGPHFIDGLIDAAKYIKAKRDGRTHNSYFNAYVDGKTNGIASNALQVGSVELARATGVLRDSGDTLLDDGDIRDQLEEDLLSRLKDEGLPGNMKNDVEDVYTIARALFGVRDLNKATTMTFSYGKEMASFKKDIEKFLGELYEQELADPQSTFPAAYDNVIKDPYWQDGKLVETLHKFYVSSLENKMDHVALNNRRLMRSAAMLHAVTDQLFTIKSATGFEIAMGGTLTEGYNPDTVSRYSLVDETGKRTGEREVAHYQPKFTSAAEKFEMVEDKQTGEKNRVGTPGQLAYGQSVTSPIQSLDAATVAMSVTGDSWKRLSEASNGNPYVHSIYDAFKFDAMGFDVGVKEVNKNWLKAGMDWSYLEETFDSTQKSMAEWDKAMAQLPQGDTINIGLDSDYRMVGYLANYRKEFESRMSKLMPTDDQGKPAVKEIMTRMENLGYTGGDTMTVAQLRGFVRAFANQINLRSRLTSAINTTNERKRKLRKEINEDEVLQYYAH